MVIVYQSNTGFTQEYAQMLGKAEKMKVYALGQDQPPKGEKVLFLGPLMAGHISGLDEANKRFSLQAVCGVGMSPPGQDVMNRMRRANYLSDLPLFYLQGGWAPKKVGWLKRRMVNMVTRPARKALLAKGTRTPQEQEQLDFLVRGGNYVAYQNLDEVRAWLKNQPR